MAKRVNFLSRRKDNPINPSQPFPLESLARSKRKKVAKALRALQEAEQKREMAKDFPHTIIFDWNGTVDARDTGVGIPLSGLVALKNLGKNIIIFTSSVQSDDKLFMRKVLEQNGIPYTDDMSILGTADMFIGDKKSDERHAGKYGAKFINVRDFDLNAVMPSSREFAKIGQHECRKIPANLPLDKRIVEEVRAYNEEYGPASVADITTELNTRCKHLVFQGQLDVAAHTNEKEVMKLMDELVKAGRLKRVENPGIKPGYIHVHVI